MPDKETVARNARRNQSQEDVKAANVSRWGRIKKTAGIIFQPIKISVACCAGVARIEGHSAHGAGAGPSDYPCARARNFRVALGR